MEEHQNSADKKDNLAQQIALVCLPHIDRVEIGNEPVLKLYHPNFRYVQTSLGPVSSLYTYPIIFQMCNFNTKAGNI